MEKEIYLLSFSFDQKCFHYETLKRALTVNMRCVLRPKSVSSFVPVAASYEEKAIRCLTHDLGRVWNHREGKPTSEEILKIVNILKEHHDDLIHFDISELIQSLP